MPRNRRLLSLTTSMVGISAALAAAQIPASAQGNATASRPWTVYAIGGSGAIAPFQVGTASPLSPFPERPLRSTPSSSVSSRDGKTLYVTSLSGPIAFVTPYNTGTGRAGRPILVGPSLFSGPLIISPDGSTLYVTTFADSGSSIVAVSTHDRTTRNVVTDIHAILLSLAMSPDGKTLYAVPVMTSLRRFPWPPVM